MFFSKKPPEMPTKDEALKGREQAISTAQEHFVLNVPLKGPYPENSEIVLFGMGCFWGAEKIFWSLPGVYVTAVGYAAGLTPNPNYNEVCTGMTGHNEIVLVVYDPNEISFETLLEKFWENHDPTQGMRQGNDVGTQYRSGIYVSDPKRQDLAESSKQAYAKALLAEGYGPITTEILDMPEFYFAEDYHQQYLAKNPNGYCGLGGTTVDYPAKG